MPTTITIDRIQLRRDLAATWASRNPTLLVGEQGVETDTRKFKIGDGITAWNALPYIGADAGTIAGTTLASNVVASSLTSVGTLSSLAVSGAASVAGTLAVSGSASFGPTWVGVVAGDFYQAYNATWNGTNWMRTDITRPAWLLQVNQANNMIFESYKAMNMWAAQPGANPIGPFTAIGGWLLVQSFSEFKDVTYGGFGIEVDGNGTVPYGRIRHATVGGAEVTDLLTNAYLDESGRDDTAQPSWSVGRVDDSFKVRRAPSGASLVWADLLAISSSGNLGIGTTPSERLHVAGNVFRHNDPTNSYGYTIDVSTTTTRLATLFGGSSFAIRTGASGTDRLFVDSTGNLGLGVTPSTTTAARMLQIGYAGSGVTAFSQTATVYTQNAYNNSGWKYGGTGQAMLYAMDAGVHAWHIAPSGTAGNAITFTQAMTLDASGNLGIGGVPGSYRLDVVGSMRCYGDVLSSATSVVTFGTLTNQNLRLATNNTFRVEIDTSGNVAIATGYLRVGGASAGAASTTTFGNGTATTVGATGAAAALPANPLGYIIAHVGTTQVKIPYYTA